MKFSLMKLISQFIDYITMMNEFEEKPTVWSNFKRFIRECIRVLKITKKPTKEEFKTISKVSGLGILIIGLIGFLIAIARTLFFK